VLHLHQAGKLGSKLGKEGVRLRYTVEEFYSAEQTQPRFYLFGLQQGIPTNNDSLTCIIANEQCSIKTFSSFYAL